MNCSTIFFIIVPALGIAVEMCSGAEEAAAHWNGKPDPMGGTPV